MEWSGSVGLTQVWIFSDAEENMDSEVPGPPVQSINNCIA